jgi:FkbM family methyltransferase
MPLIVQTPRNASVIADCGPYPHRLNVLNRKQTAVQRQLRRGGLASYEPSTQATLLALMQLAPAGAAFFDVGAHIGLYSALVDLILSSRGVRVFAFEPTPTTAAISRAMKRENGLSFELVELALSEKPGTATLYVSAKAETSNSLNPEHREHAGEFTVEVNTLDLFTAGRSVDPAVIKIDVETNEPNVLAGAYDTIARARPAIVCEILPGTMTQIEPHVRALADLGYHAYLLTDTLPWPARQVADFANLADVADPDARDWLFLPEPLSYRLTDTVATWLDAIAVCDESTNLLVPAGTKPPSGWNADHPLSQRKSLRDRLPFRR